MDCFDKPVTSLRQVDWICKHWSISREQLEWPAAACYTARCKGDCPRLNRSMFSAITSAIMPNEDSVTPPTCGVAITFGSVRMGSSVGRGSAERRARASTLE